MENNTNIKPIDKTTVNQICSGQVVLNLATAVKELVENSLDAGATSIQIRLIEYGSESIEVIDNGCGVQESNHQGLTLKHHTSKISNFGDLCTVETFGFRGEALSSLCALATVTVLTKHSDSNLGSRLHFDHNGLIVKKTTAPRQVGTTVTVENLFSTLPVRHKEFHRNLKREFGRMCSVLQAYALLNYHCSINCSNKTNGKSRIVLETRSGSIRGNIGSIFGTKQLQDLLEIVTVYPDDDILSEFRCTRITDVKLELQGFISSCAHGSGRAGPDRQYFYINSRPIDNNKLSRLIHELYHQYNPHQNPFIVLDIRTNYSSVDVNVVPDKRQIFMEHENYVFAVVKASIVVLFCKVPSTLPFQTLGSSTNRQEVERKGSPATSLFERFASKSGSPLTSTTPSEVLKQPSMKQFVTNQSCKVRQERTLKRHDDEEDAPAAKKPKYIVTIEASVEGEIQDLHDNHKTISNDIEMAKDKIELIGSRKIPEISNEDIFLDTPENSEESPKNYQSEKSMKLKGNEEPDREQTYAISSEIRSVLPETPEPEIDEGLTVVDRENRKILQYQTSINLIKMRRSKTFDSSESTTHVKFFAKIAPNANDHAEKELRRELSQSSFGQMQVIGQFNKGFIITQLGSDLFIIDQHATDEKYNFENLSQAPLQSQPLTVPQQLRLTAGNEELLLSRAETIRANGFDFLVDEEAPCSQRIRLSAVPMAKGVTLGSRDVDELLFLLEDAPHGHMCRPSRVRDIMASRACRMSVMVGTALNTAQMKRLVSHMGEMDQPWNCPHGRPTIRHLVSLELINSQVETDNLPFG